MKVNSIRIFDEVPYDDPLVMAKAAMLTDAVVKIVCDQIFARLTNTVVIDGRPGIGKTTIVDGIKKRLLDGNIPYCVVSSDDDVMERPKRPGHSLLEYHEGAIVSEAARIHFSPSVVNSAGLNFMKYRTKSGLHDFSEHYDVPGQSGVLIAEGVKASEFIIKAVSGERREVQAKVLFVFLDAPVDVINGRRFNRDVNEKGLGVREVQHRIDSQEVELAAFAADTFRDFGVHDRVEVKNR